MMSLRPWMERRLCAGYITIIVLNMENRWWIGRDLNLGPLGCQPSTTGGLRHVSKREVNYGRGVCVEITEELINEFEGWLRKDNLRFRESTIKQYMYYMPRLVGLRLCGKEDTAKVFEVVELNKSSYEAFSKFLTFLEKTRELDELVVRLREAMPKKPKVRADTYIPTDEEILKVRGRIRELGPPHTLIYDVLVNSGFRGSEARYLIENIKKFKAVDLDSFVRVHVDLQRGSKNEFVMYLPKEVYNELLKWDGKLPHQDTVEDIFREAGLNIKYFRKWWRLTLKQLGIDSEDIEAYQGRITTIGGKHYTDFIPILDKNYSKIQQKIKQYLINTN